MTFYAETGTHRLEVAATTARNAALDMIRAIMGTDFACGSMGKVIVVSDQPFDTANRQTSVLYTEGLLDELGYEVATGITVPANCAH